MCYLYQRDGKVVVARYKEKRQIDKEMIPLRGPQENRQGYSQSERDKKEEQADKAAYDREVLSAQLQIVRARLKERFNALSPAEQKLEKRRALKSPSGE